MKKLLIVLIIFVGIAFQATAQNDTDKIQDQIQEMTQEMQKLMSEFQGLMGTSLEMTDSLVQKSIIPMAENFRGLEQFSTDSTDFNSLIDMMQLQMNQLSEQDWGSLERLMQEFGEKMPSPKNSKDKKDGKRPTTDM